MKTWQELKAEIDQTVADTTFEADKEVKDTFQYCISRGGAGVPDDNQIFTTWFFGGADVNYIADWCYFLMKLARKDTPYEKMAKIFRFWVLQPAEFGNYCGLRKQYGYVKQIEALLGSIDTAALVSLLDSLRCYYANINTWVFQIMPWGVGYAFPRKDREYFKEGAALI